MGVSLAIVKLLAKEARRRPFGGVVATLGRQHVYATENEIRQILKSEGVGCQPKTFQLHTNPELALKGYVSDDSLFSALGFERVVRIDVDNYEGVEVILDLNQPDTPAELMGRFDAVLDFGTLEHVYHVPNAMRHIARLLSPTGRAIHMLPASNCVEHGFYSFSPTFLRDHYQASQFEINTLLLCRASKHFERGVWTLYDYPPDYPQCFSMGQLDGGVYVVYAVVTATDQVITGVTPQQGYYSRVWASQSKDGSSRAEGKAEWLLGQLVDKPKLKAVAEKMIHGWRRFRNGMQKSRRGVVPLRRVGKI